jgi:hypothetical protein
MPDMKKLYVLLLCGPLVAHAEWGRFDAELEESKPWVEAAVQLPAYPQAENLLPFTVSSATRNRHFIDAASLSVGDDGVVRYTVVIDAAGGARNVMFEGLRCATAERRLYAYGRADGTWSRARNADWEGIKVRSLLSYHKPLFEEILCPAGIAVRNAGEAVRNLRQAAR